MRYVLRKMIHYVFFVWVLFLTGLDAIIPESWRKTHDWINKAHFDGMQIVWMTE